MAIFEKIKIYQKIKNFPFCRAHLLLYIRGGKLKKTNIIAKICKKFPII